MTSGANQEANPMAVYNAAFPVLPGKVDAGRAFAKEVMGARRSGFDESQARGGISRETWTLQENPDGSALVLVWFECPDPEQVFADIASDSSEFTVWFREQVKDISGIDFSEGGGGVPEVVVDWKA
jgi:hypothetical protein